jgi:RNA-directed DNA polymerase
VLHEDITTLFPVHDSAFAYRKGISLSEHAKAHSFSHFILRMDFKNFFESISDTDIENYINLNSSLISKDWDNKDTELFIKIVCYKRSLTIGSVTSPSISNFICYDLDIAIVKLCSAHDVKYTRYADDLYFSSKKPNILKVIEKNVYTIVAQLKVPKKLKINNLKTHHTSRKNKMSVTGLVLTNDGKVSLGRDKKRKIRSMVHQWDNLNGKDKKYLVGYLSFCVSIEPEFINTLCNKYGAEVIFKIQRYLNKTVSS